MNFKDYYNAKSVEPVKKRHMHPIGRDPSSHPKSPGKFVPDMWRSNNNTVNEFEYLKNVESGVKTINKAKADKLCKQFSITSMPGTLGNTGITIAPHPSSSLSFMLKK